MYPQRNGEASFPARAVTIQGKNLRLRYEPLSVEEEELLTLVLYSDADAWLGRGEQRQPDQPLRSFLRLVRLSVRGVGHALVDWIPRRHSPKIAAARAEAVTLLLAALLAGTAVTLHAQKNPAARSAAAPVPAADEGSFHSSFTLKDVGPSRRPGFAKSAFLAASYKCCAPGGTKAAILLLPGVDRPDESFERVYEWHAHCHVARPG